VSNLEDELLHETASAISSQRCREPNFRASAFVAAITTSVSTWVANKESNFAQTATAAERMQVFPNWRLLDGQKI
jgi:hypothetical protein